MARKDTHSTRRRDPFRTARRLAAVGILWLSVGVTFADSGVSCAVASDALKFAEKIRKLRHKSPVPCFLRDREQVREFIVTTLKEKIPAEKLAGEERLFKAVGVIPKDFEYASGIVDLYLSQLGGYYDPEKDHYVMASWLPAAMQPAIAVHELTHALQDQHYDLATFMDHKTGTTDLLLARSALVEGDATAVMTDFTRLLAGQSPLVNESSVDAIILQNVIGSAFMQGFTSAPRSLQMILLFPYSSGLRFAHAQLKAKGYERFSELFKRPPRSTEEILHPEVYEKGGMDYREISESELRSPLGGIGTIEYQDTLGEFVTSVLLAGAGIGKHTATEAAKGWGGDRGAIIISPSGEREVVWVTAWDSDRDAEEFLVAFRATRDSQCEEAGVCRLSRQDRTVTFRSGVP